MKCYDCPLLVVGILASQLLGCKDKATGAKESFASAHTCPIDRVEVRERTDVKQASLYPKAPPPADIAQDPERLKMWKDQQATLEEEVNRSCEMWEARGCDIHELLCCRRPKKNGTRATYLDRYSCVPHSVPSSMPKW